MMKLSQLHTGQSALIHELPGGVMRAQFIRLGLQEGIRIHCLQRLPGGTLVVEHNRQEIALSGDLADQILVR